MLGQFPLLLPEQPPKGTDAMTPICPRCRSSQVATRNHARKAGGAIGAIAGAASSFSAAMKGAQVGNRLGMIAGPAGMVTGTIAGAILGGLIGGAAGCSAGIALGELIDLKVLDNYRCLDCRYTFGHSLADPPPYAASDSASEDHWLPAADTDEHLHERHF